MNRGRKITYKGETHTVAEWAEITGIHVQTLRNRLTRSGGDMDYATRKPEPSKSYEYRGRKMTASQIAKLNGTLTPNGVESRIFNGWSIEEIVHTPKGKPRRGMKMERKTDPNPKPAQSPKTPDVSQCRNCKYRGWVGSTIHCDYIGVKLRRRPCPPSPHCTVKEAGAPIRPMETRHLKLI